MNWLRKPVSWIHNLLADQLCEEKSLLPGKSRSALHLEHLEARDLPSTAASIATPTYIVHHASSSAPTSGGYSPSQILAAYGINSITFSGVSGTGSGETIAIVDAYNDPDIANDLAAFDAAYGLSAPPSFKVVNQSGQTTNLPGTDPSSLGNDWELEESLDVEWAHAIAPGANIVLVEATNDSTSNLFAAVAEAAKIGNVVSISWGIQGGFSGETSYDSYFNVSGVTFVASTGDNGSPGSYRPSHLTWSRSAVQR